jgi:hypothetical protein
MDKAFQLWLPRGSYSRIITGDAALALLHKFKNSELDNLNDKILNANSIAKSSSMVDENLHGDCLQLLTCEVDHFFILIIPF